MKNDLSNISWNGYKGRIFSKKSHQLNERRELLSKVREIWSEEKFRELPELERKSIAGTVGKIDLDGTSLKGYDWKLFGSMAGPGYFKKLIKDNSLDISSALDEIPFDGRVEQNHYKRFIDSYIFAFRNFERTGRVGPASRLLAMKRPDFFLCVTSKSAAYISKEFGVSRYSICKDFEHYWNKLVVPITNSNWWNTDPSSIEKEDIDLWHNRVILLDSLFYEESS